MIDEILKSQNCCFYYISKLITLVDIPYVDLNSKGEIIGSSISFKYEVQVGYSSPEW